MDTKHEAFPKKDGYFGLICTITEFKGCRSVELFFFLQIQTLCRGQVPITVLGLFVSAWLQFKKGLLALGCWRMPWGPSSWTSTTRGWITRLDFFWRRIVLSQWSTFKLLGSLHIYFSRTIKKFRLLNYMSCSERAE